MCVCVCVVYIEWAIVLMYNKSELFFFGFSDCANGLLLHIWTDEYREQ